MSQTKTSYKNFIEYIVNIFINSFHEGSDKYQIVSQYNYLFVELIKSPLTNYDYLAINDYRPNNSLLIISMQAHSQCTLLFTIYQCSNSLGTNALEGVC